MKRIALIFALVLSIFVLSSCSMSVDEIVNIILNNDSSDGECLHEVLYEIAERESTCTVQGNEKYYVCSCGDKFRDEYAIFYIYSAPKLPLAEHTYVGGVCSKCGTAQPSQPSQPSQPDTHTHVLTKHPATSANCIKNGNEVYYTCSCGKIFLDSSAMTETASIPVLSNGTHSYSGGACVICGDPDDNYQGGSSTVNKPTATEKKFSDIIGDNGPLTENGLPSIGSPKVLVVPINLDSSNATDKVLADIEIAFNGTQSETGWYSVSEFYEISSYGKLHLEFEVIDRWFTPSKSASYYNSYYDEDTMEYGSDLILDEVMDYYNSTYDFSEFDYDNDECIDAIWLIYNCDVDYESDDGLYWAFQTTTYTEKSYDGVYPYYYAFAGTDFMYDESDVYDSENIKVDAHTFIHETGHLMGLDDYYDYDSGTGEVHGGLFGGDMMDSNIGDHCSITKILLGWVSPTVIDGVGAITIDLTSFTNKGKVLLISDHKIESIYDEYFLIEFYTSDGLNENDQPIYDKNTDSVYGVRILHVDARKNYDSNGEVDWNAGDAYETGYLYDNSDTSKKFVKFLEATESYGADEWAYSDMLYDGSNGVFGVNSYRNYKYNRGGSLNFTLKVNSVNSTKASVTITLS